MADSIDKFVLSYIVETRDSLKRLEQLQQSVKKTGKEANESKKKIKEIATEAIPGVGAALGTFDKLSGMLKKIPPQAYVAVAGIIAIAGAIKLLTANLKEYDAQRATAQKTGMNAIQVEDFQRKMSRGSGGRIGSESARGAVEAISEKLRSAQVNPNMNNREAIGLRMAGVSTRGASGELTSTTDAIHQMMEKMRTSSEEAATAMGAVNGLTIDQSKALREYALAQGTSSALTHGEMQARMKANASMEVFKKSMGVVDEQLRETRQTLGDALSPALEVFGLVLEKLAGFVNKTVRTIVDVGQYMVDFYTNLWANIKAAIKNPGDAGFGAALMSAVKDADQKAADMEQERKRKVTDKEAAQYNKRAEADQRQIIQYERAANLFSNAVMSFANAVDEREAWAAWAGMAGSASGLRGGPQGGSVAPAHPRFGETPVAGAGIARGQTQAAGQIGPGVDLAPSQAGAGPSKASMGNEVGARAAKYKDLIQESAKKHNVPAELIAKVISAESSFNPAAVSNQGAQGLMQLMPEIQKAYGIKDAFDPKSNIDGGARLLAENLKMSGGDINKALKIYHGGPNQKIWGAKTNAYPGKVLGQNVGQASATDQQSTAIAPASPARVPGRFEAPSPSTMARNDVIRNIESATGVPFNQIKQGGMSKGDMEKTLGEMYNGQLNNINGIKTRLEGVGMPATEIAKLQRDLQTAQRNLETMKRVGAEVAGTGAEGGRNITFGANSVIISIDGAQNPYATAKATREEFYKQTDKASVNQQSTSIKR